MTVLDQIRRLLNDAGASYREIMHAPTSTSQESATARGEPLGVGAKALLLRVDDTFQLFVLAADRKLDSKQVKRHFGAKSVRFATAEELRAQTGLLPGSVPPFGQPILPVALFADPDVGVRYGRVAFNAGSLTVSIVMSAADWQAIARPERISIACS